MAMDCLCSVLMFMNHDISSPPPLPAISTTTAGGWRTPNLLLDSEGTRNPTTPNPETKSKGPD
jgi:hypothetical protein